MAKHYDCLHVNDKLIWNLRDIAHTMRHIAEGKGSQKRILMILRETGPVTQSDLTQRLGIQPGSASEVISKLEISGYITRASSEADRRTMVITLTESGQSAAEYVLIQRKERHEQMFACLTDEEKETLQQLLEKVNTDWNARYRESFHHHRGLGCRKKHHE